MLPKNRTGNILVPLVVILALSVGVFILSKYLSTSQANVETAIESRYQTALSSKMDPQDQWQKAENKKYKFSFMYPKQWVGATSVENKNGTLYEQARFLSKKVNLKVSIYKNYDIPQTIKPAKFGPNTFYLIQDEDSQKVAVAKENNLYYVIEFTQNAYFADELQYKGTLFNLLKNFEFLN